MCVLHVWCLLHYKSLWNISYSTFQTISNLTFTLENMAHLLKFFFFSKRSLLWYVGRSFFIKVYWHVSISTDLSCTCVVCRPVITSWSWITWMGSWRSSTRTGWWVYSERCGSSPLWASPSLPRSSRPRTPPTSSTDRPSSSNRCEHTLTCGE